MTGSRDGVKACGCPWCAAPLDAATSVDGEDFRPTPGDVTVCFYCARVCVFGEDLVLRRPTDSEHSEFATDERLLRAVAAVKRHGPRDPGRKIALAAASIPTEGER